MMKMLRYGRDLEDYGGNVTITISDAWITLSVSGSTIFPDSPDKMTVNFFNEIGIDNEWFPGGITLKVRNFHPDNKWYPLEKIKTLYFLLQELTVFNCDLRIEEIFPGLYRDYPY